MSRYSEKERQRRCELVQRFPQSGLNKSDFCRQNELPINSFDYWRRMAKERDPSGSVGVQFIQVEVAASEKPDCVSTSPDVEVVLPFGVKLRFFGVGAREL